MKKTITMVGCLAALVFACSAETSGPDTGSTQSAIRGSGKSDAGATACVPACPVGQECEHGQCVPDVEKDGGAEATCATPCGAGFECEHGQCVPDVEGDGGVEPAEVEDGGGGGGGGGRKGKDGG